MKKEIVFECNCCGRCCKYWNIALNIKDIETIQKLGYKTKDFIDLGIKNPNLKMIKNRCFFLDKDDKCSIEKKFGYGYKPDICKNFPHNEIVCGNPKFSKRKNKPKSDKRDIFFRINKKLIVVKDFLNNLEKINTSKPLFESYCKFLYVIMKQKKDLIYKKINPVKGNIKISKSLEKHLKYPIMFTAGILSRIKHPFKKDITIELPIQKFSINLKKTEIPRNLRKKILKFICKKDMGNTFFNFPIHLLFIFYFLPFFSKAVAKNKKIKLIHVLKAYSLISSLFRFKNISSDLLKDKIVKINFKLNKLIKKA